MSDTSSTPPTSDILARIKRPPGQRYYTVDQRTLILETFQAWPGNAQSFCAQHEVTETTLYAWLRLFRAHGSTGLKEHVRGRPTRKPRRGLYTPEQRRATVESFLKSGQGAEPFAKVWGVTPRILRIWVKAYKTGGPKALEGRPGRKPGQMPVHPAVAAAIVETKTAYPTFGLRKVRDFLARFKGVKASPPVIRRVVQEAQLPPAPRPARRWKKRHLPIRFQRAKPGEMWQSDITSFVLPRTGQRVYLTVFLDDHSRYIVSWKLAMRQTEDLVIESLLEGIQRWGKPREILTDQGRQYTSWRGKSAFQKMLIKQGITHVVSRAHHPETLGKCERLWATVGEEFWSRVQPNELSDAQARLAHFFAHYNHFRPHQGLDGSVPADRFFGVAGPVRAAIEAQMVKNELAMALGETPRPPTFLVGSIGGQAWSVHGESGKLVVQTPQGVVSELAYDANQGALNARPEVKEADDERGRDSERGGNEHGGRDTGEARGEAAGADAAQAGVCDAPGGMAGEGAVGSGEPGRPGGGAPDGDAAVRTLAGAAVAEGVGGEDRATPGAGVAAEPAGLGRAGGGTVEAAGDAPEGDAAPPAEAERGGSPAAAEGAGGSAAAECDPGGPVQGPAGVPRGAPGAPGDGDDPETACSARTAEGEKKPGDTDERSAPGSSGTGADSGELTGAGSPASSG